MPEEDLFNEFISETRELLDNVDDRLVNLEKDPENKELLNEIFRVAHTIKGTAAFLELNSVSEFSHKLEDVLGLLRDGKIKLTSDLMDLLFEGFDTLRKFLDELEEKGEIETQPTELEKKLINIVQTGKPETLFKEVPKEEKPKEEKPEKPKEGTKEIKKEEEKEIVEEKVPEGVGLEEFKAIVDEFINESEDLLRFCDEKLRELEKTPDNPEAIQEVMRVAHTIKGSASFLGLERISKLSGKLEEILFKVKESQLTMSGALAGVLLAGFENIKNLITGVKEHRKEPEVNIDPLIEKMDDLFKKKPEKPKGKVTPKRPTIEETVRINVHHLDKLVDLMGEVMLRRNTLDEILRKLKQKYEDPLMDMFERTLGEIQRITEDLNYVIQRIRMLPVDRVFSKFPRMVRDLSRKLGKKVELEIRGEETTLDKTVLENIEDPLVHIIRNSIDHGIENEEERKKKGKPPIGKIILSAYHEGEKVIIEIKDDGRGIDIDKIRKKALEKRLATPEEISAMSDREVLRFIFEPGFSTKEKVSDMSGRGVGMDVVKANVERLDGHVEIDTEKDKGTTIKLMFPLTLAIIKALVVRVNDEYYAVPIGSVFKIVQVMWDEVKTIEGKEVLRLLDKIIPVVRLSELLGLGEGPKGEKRYIVIVEESDKLVGLEVTELIGQEDIVKKALTEHANAPQCISGATIRGDGRVALILDIPELVHMITQEYKSAMRAAQRVWEEEI